MIVHFSLDSRHGLWLNYFMLHEPFVFRFVQLDQALLIVVSEEKLVNFPFLVFLLINERLKLFVVLHADRVNQVFVDNVHASLSFKTKS